MGQIFAPSHADEGSSRETDRADAGEVVVDGRRAVTVVGAHLADAVHSCSLIAAEADGLLQVVDAHLIQQVIPLGIVVIHAAQVSQLEAVLCAGGDVLCVGGIVLLVVDLSVGVCVVEDSLDLIAHVVISRSGSGLSIVCKTVRTGQIGDLALCEIELIGRCNSVALALVGLVVNDVGSNSVGLGIQNIVGVRVGADDVIASLQHIAAVVLVIVGSQILDRDGEVDGLALAGGKLAGLGEVQQVCGGLLNAAVGVRRIIIDLHDILAGSRAGIGDGDGELQAAAVAGDVAHLLGEGGVAQAVAKGIDNFLVVVDEAFIGSSLIELVADIDALSVVDEGCSSACGVEEAGIGIQLGGVGVLEVTEVVPPRRSGQVSSIGVSGTAGGVDLTGDHAAKALKAGLTGAGAEQDALDLGVVLDPVHLESVCAVVNDDDVVEVGSDEVDELFLAVGQLQEVVALIPVIALVQAVIVSAVVVAGAALRTTVICHTADPAAVHDSRHVGGKVCALTADAGDDDHSGVRVCLGICHHLVGVQADIRLGQSPVLLGHTNAGTGSAVVGVELAQLVVGLDARIVQAGEQVGDGIDVVQCAGAGAAVARAGGGPAKDVQLGARGHRQDVVIVLCQNDALLRDLVHQLGRLCGGLLADGTFAGDQIQYGGHGAGADEVDDNRQRQQNGEAGLRTDHLLFRFGHLPHREHHEEREYEDDAECNQIVLNVRNYLHYIIHIDGQHNFLPPYSESIFSGYSSRSIATIINGFKENSQTSSQSVILEA